MFSDAYILKNYNNLYNRVLKEPKPLVTQYNDNRFYTILNSINFDPSDGVTTQLVTLQPMDVGDYVIITDIGDYTVRSRWFVLDSTKLTQGANRGMFMTVLKRDVLADNYDDVKQMPCFIEKGYVDEKSPLIFNNENMSYNQVKTKEIILENNLKTPWIVAYLSRYHTSEDGKTQEYNEFKGSFKDEGVLKADYELDSLESYKYNYWVNNAYRYAADSVLWFGTSYNQKNPDTGGSLGKYTYWLTPTRQENESNYGGSTEGLPSHTGPVTIPDDRTVYNELLASYHTYDSAQNGLPINSISLLGSQAGFNTLQAENGKIIKVGAKYYRISAYGSSKYKGTSGASVRSDNAPNLYNLFNQKISVPVFGQNVNSIVDWPYTLPTNQLTIKEIETTNINYDITYTGAVTRDAAYEIIATPYLDTTFTINGFDFKSNGSIGLQWFQDIANRYNAAGWLYDIQIVPYISIDEKDISNQSLVYATRATDKLAVAIKLPSASFNYSKAIEVPMRSSKKIGNEVDYYRFCSPNGVGAYDFNPYKNGGLTSYEADITLLPYNPYIKIHPTFGGLYGNLEKDDFRGLICGGDFSLPILNNAWSTYELNNKYYQQQFQRNIDSQIVKNKWAKAESFVNADVGGVGSAVAGAAVGSYLGPVGTVAGGAVGAIAGLATGVVDVIEGVQLREDELKRQKDQFGYALQTIKAQANTLTRTTSYNISNKYFPYIEYYTATDVEVEALTNKLKYDGMSVGVIGKITDFVKQGDTTFIKATPIRMDISGDFHIANEISNRLQGGIYYELSGIA